MEDIVFTEGFPSTIQWSNNQSGALQAPTAVLPTLPGWAGGLQVGNFNGDAFNDLAVINIDPGNQSAQIYVYEGLGGGAFGAPYQVTPAGGPSVTSFDVGDVDGDGNPDIVAGFNTAQVAWAPYGTNSAPFAAWTFIPAPLQVASSVKISDITGDSISDIILGVAGQQVVAVLGTGGGAFATTGLTLGNLPFAVFLIRTLDIGLDGTNDILVGASPQGGPQSVHALINTGGGWFQSPIAVTPTMTLYSMNVDDFDGDGGDDLICGHDLAATWFKNQLVVPWQLSMAQNPAGDLTIALGQGTPASSYNILYSADSLNATHPGSGLLFGLHLSLGSLASQINLSVAGDSRFGGALDATGNYSYTIPAFVFANLSGISWWGVGIRADPQLVGAYAATAVSTITIQ